MILCSLKPSFEKIESSLKKAGFQWYLDEAINYGNDFSDK
jgi:hypothetical protein